jgi:hypothetical protein
VSRALLEPSRRVDVPTSLVPDYVLPQPGVKYDIDQYSEEWQEKSRPSSKNDYKRRWENKPRRTGRELKLPRLQ